MKIKDFISILKNFNENDELVFKSDLDQEFVIDEFGQDFLEDGELEIIFKSKFN